MTMQMSSKLARLGARFVALGERHREFEERIARVEKQPNPDQIVLTRLKRAKLRVRDEMSCYEGILRTLGQEAQAATGARKSA